MNQRSGELLGLLSGTRGFLFEDIREGLAKEMLQHGEFVAKEVTGSLPVFFLVLVAFLNTHAEIRFVSITRVLKHRSGNRTMPERDNRTGLLLRLRSDLGGCMGHE